MACPILIIEIAYYSKTDHSLPPCSWGTVSLDPRDRDVGSAYASSTSPLVCRPSPCSTDAGLYAIRYILLALRADASPMDSLGRIVAVFLLSVHFLLRCQAQTVHGFNWAFPFTSLNIQECQNSSVQLKSLNTSSSFVGVPPYYMLALEVQGVTTRTLLGNDPTQLSWQNTHHQGAQLLLTVQDSAGYTAGFPSHFYSVIGVKPYNVTFGQVGSGVITQVPMGPADDVFTYINRADPNEPLMAAVVDA
ncbi:hypothetical protein BN946_scf185000.g80 [Trametes cinnabarina]|uniref:Uncharacterized protein n=1 Tax=Pycnoporus cinnabarinus TaxID=5643 RepID=A0A060S3E7_PYCCI|nr:hypothetical protein BN946_scf185000.g80 [Trametes cinnabarina]